MNVSLQQFEKAFSEFQMFGPRRRIPIEQRWQEVLPEIDFSKFITLKEQCKEIEVFALSLAEQVRDKQIQDSNAQQQLAQKYPFLTKDRLDHTWNQAVYFSFK